MSSITPSSLGFSLTPFGPPGNPEDEYLDDYHLDDPVSSSPANDIVSRQEHATTTGADESAGHGAAGNEGKSAGKAAGHSGVRLDALFGGSSASDDDASARRTAAPAKTVVKATAKAPGKTAKKTSEKASVARSATTTQADAPATAEAGGHEVETVYIPEENRGTLCISSQVGCTLTCSFCHTGTQKLVRNLTAGEIVGQVMVARDDLGEWPKPGEPKDETRLVSNVVLMGMGEPLYNFDNVRDAMKVVMDGEGISLSRRRITLSTSGIVPEIAKTAEEIGCLLAVSFHATEDATRDRLVPVNKKWNIETLLNALRDYPRLSNSERITFEYVMLDGVNDSDADARRLVKLIRGIPAKINLIPFNEWPGAPYKRSSWERIEAFADIVHKAGYASPIRTPRGEDIMAACGQLKSATERGRKSAAQIAAEARA